MNSEIDPTADRLTDAEIHALVLITADLGWEPKSARGFIAGYLWRSTQEHLGKVPDSRDIADAYYEWFYSLTEGTMKWYRTQDTLDLTKE